jgi:(p)ppGpp synthase/HD superfamily hydrolase
VAEVIARVGGVADLAVLQAAVLHDALEDTKTTREELAERFGERVARIVAEVNPAACSVASPSRSSTITTRTVSTTPKAIASPSPASFVDS